MADRERDRFVALAFCRADLLFELDDTHRVIFSAGATNHLLGHQEEALKGNSFLDLVTPSERPLIKDMLDAASLHGRLDDVVVSLSAPGGRRITVAMAGYRVPDFDDHLFLALKAGAQRHDVHIAEEHLVRDGDSGLLDQESYAALATQRAIAFRQAGGQPQLTLVKIDRLESLTSKLGVSERKKIMAVLGDILTRHSLGEGTAGQLDSDAFSYVHREDVDTGAVNALISDAARKLFDTDLRPRSQTLDADGAGLAEEQVAKAIAHTIRVFASDPSALDKKKSIAQVLQGMVSDTIGNIAYMRQIVAGHDFDIAFMPVCDLRLERVHHFEALTRFRDSRMGTSPFHMFSLAEEVGIVHELDMAVCETTLRTLGNLLRKDPSLPAVAINLSGQSISNPVFVDELRKLLVGSGLPPRKILFEITESVRIEELMTVNAVIQSFRQRGYRFCVDDFGSGAASLDYLNALEVDIVKFDGPVVQRACATQRGSDLLSAMAKLCASMGVRTAAEMVEDKRTAGRVYQCSVDLGQGYYFGRPDFDPFTYSPRFVGAAR